MMFIDHDDMTPCRCMH